MALGASLQAGPRARRWLALAGGSSVVAGLFAFSAPSLAALALVRVLGVWLILRGASEWLAGASLCADEAGAVSKRLAREHRYVAFNGAMSMLFGVGLMAAPRVGGLSLVWAIGGWAILHGLLMLRWALHIRRASGYLPEPTEVG
jgi:uncharacterized membrane protein HdeD (DUF308 family)